MRRLALSAREEVASPESSRESTSDQWARDPDESPRTAVRGALTIRGLALPLISLALPPDLGDRSVGHGSWQ